jgi:hypothetical protein
LLPKHLSVPPLSPRRFQLASPKQNRSSQGPIVQRSDHKSQLQQKLRTNPRHHPDPNDRL